MSSVDRAVASQKAPHVRTSHTRDGALSGEKLRLMDAFGVPAKLRLVKGVHFQMGEIVGAPGELRLAAYYHEPMPGITLLEEPTGRVRQVRSTILVATLVDSQAAKPQDPATLPEIYLALAIEIDPRRFNNRSVDQSFRVDDTLGSFDEMQDLARHLRNPLLSVAEMMRAIATLGGSKYVPNRDLTFPGPRGFMHNGEDGIDRSFDPWGLYRGDSIAKGVEGFDRQLSTFILAAGFHQKPLAAYAEEARLALGR